MEAQLLIHICNLLERELVNLAKRRVEASREDQEYRAFCALCAAEMIQIIESLKGSDYLHTKPAKFIQCLLRNLDRVCSYSVSAYRHLMIFPSISMLTRTQSKKHKNPAMSAMSVIGHQTGSDQSRSSYPSLRPLAAIQDASMMPKSVSDGLECFTISDKRGRLLDSLRKTTYRLRTHSPDEDYLEPESNTAVGCDPPDKRDQMTALFQVVGRHRVCNCTPRCLGPTATYL